MAYKVGDRVRLKLDEPLKNEKGIECKSKRTLRQYLLDVRKVLKDHLDKEYFVIHSVKRNRLFPYLLEGIEEVHFSDYDIELYSFSNSIFSFKK